MMIDQNTLLMENAELEYYTQYQALILKHKIWLLINKIFCILTYYIRFLRSFQICLVITVGFTIHML